MSQILTDFLTAQIYIWDIAGNLKIMVQFY